MTRWRRALRHRSPAEWTVRIALVAGGGALGMVAILQSMANALPSNQLERAHALSPGNARIAAALSEKLSGPEATASDRARADRLAHSALLQDATAVEAAATLGINALARGDHKAARRAFGYSQRLSRRDLRTQLWVIQDAVERGDATEALNHYDIVLRTKRNGPELLYPILGEAIADPAIRSGTVAILAQRPPWAGSFIDYAARNGPDAVASAALFRALRAASMPVTDAQSSAVIGALVAAKKYEEAWAYYALVRPGADRRAGRDADFAADLAEPAPFDWQATNEGGVSVSIQQRPEGGLVDFAVPASVSAVIVRQWQMLPPGRYRLEGHSVGIEQPAAALPYWSLTCVEGAELGRVTVPNSAERAGSFAGTIEVPAGCAVQTLALTAPASDQIGGLTGQIDLLRLFPAR